MQRNRAWIRALLGFILVAACLAAAILPALPSADGVEAAPGTSAPPGDLVISSFRLRGPNGVDSQFVEIFNRSCTTTQTLTGWQLRYSVSNVLKDQVLYPFPPGTKLEPGRYYLVASKGYPGPSDGIYNDGTNATPNPVDAINPDEGGVALFSSDVIGIDSMDEVGVSIDGYHEGRTALTPVRIDTDQSYVRKKAAGKVIDTNDNSKDFTLRTYTPHTYKSGDTGTCGSAVTATPGPGVGDYMSVLINEIGWAGTRASPNAEWIELYNNTDKEIDFGADKGKWTLYSLTATTPDIVLTGKIPARGYYLLLQVTSAQLTATPSSCIAFLNVDYDQLYSGLLSDYGGRLQLYGPKGPVDSANIRDTAWRAGSLTNDASMERRGAVPDSSTAWITYANPGGNPKRQDCKGDNVYGTPKQKNWADQMVQTPFPTSTRYKTATPRPPTPFGHMVINEFLPRAGFDWNQDGSVDVYDEFIELKNLGPVDAQLSGWKLNVISPQGSTTYSLGTVTLKTDERAVFYGIKTKLSLYDSGGTVRLLNNRGIVIDARSYGPVQAPDETHCRLPDGYYWRFPCFPTPGNENSLTGTRPSPPPAIASQPPPCLMADIIPAPFRNAECYSFGADVYNPAYWDDAAGFKQFPVRDVINKWRAVVE